MIRFISNAISSFSVVLCLLLLPCVVSAQTGKTDRQKYPDYETLKNSELTPVLVPGQERAIFTLYGAPSDPEELKMLVSVMKDKKLGVGFDPGPRPMPYSKELNAFLEELKWPIITYMGDMQIKFGRDSISEAEEAVRQKLDESGAVTYVQLGEWGYYFHRLSFDQSWLRESFGGDTQAAEKYAKLAPVRDYWGYRKEPKTRQDCYDELKDYFLNRNEAFRDRIISITGHSHYELYAAQWGAKIVGLELGENIAFTQSKIAFVRGAARQWNRPFSIQISPWFGGDCTSTGELRGTHGNARGQDAGHSLSFYERLWLHSWFAGAAIVTPENSFDAFFGSKPNSWTTNEKGEEVANWKLSSHGEKGAQVFQFMEAHDRGIPYIPIVVVLDHLSGYNGYTGKTFGYLERTPGDWQIYDFFEEQMFPGSDHIHKSPDPNNPEVSYMRPTPFGESVDVVLSTVKSNLLKNYPVILLLGDQQFQPDFVGELKTSLTSGSKLLLSEEHANLLGTQLDELKQAGTVEVLKATTLSATNRPAVISNEKMAEQVKHYLPISVEGSPIEYQINRNQTGWVIELINNDGVSKHGHLPAVIDESKVANVTLTPCFPTEKYTIWRCGSADESHSIDRSGSVTISIPAGKTAFVEFKTSDPFGWNSLTPTSKPSCFWWWLGSCVSEQEIERQMKMLKQAGFGGVMVCPLYEYKNPTLPMIPYNSDRWIEVFKFTLEQGKKLDMVVDVTTGGGWPIGGPWVTKEDSERDWQLELLAVESTQSKPFIIRDEPGKAPIYCVTLLDSSDSLNNEQYSNLKPATIIEPQVIAGNSEWKIPPIGKSTILVSRMGYTNLDVYVAGPGGHGLVIDWYSESAWENMVKPLEAMFEKLGDLRPRAVFCDSYEGRSGTTPKFFDAFERVNGYDVRPYLHHFLKESSTPENIRLWRDYRRTMSDLHIDFVHRYTQWANANGTQTRYQYDGDPTNPVNSCAAADIPEDYAPFSTAPAHFFGKKIVSEEAFTWGTGHNFSDNLDFYRNRGDASLLTGVNHKIYHGVPFTPVGEPWPGPMYYAGGNFSETQPFFKHINYLNDYFARLSLLLQESQPDPDILFLWSIYDFWNLPNVGGFNVGQPFVWRNTNSAFERPDIKRDLAAEFTARGMLTDYVSDEILIDHTSVENGLIKTGEVSYKVLIVPETKMVGPNTLEKIEQLVVNGGTVIFMKSIPSAAPVGLPLIQKPNNTIAAKLTDLAKKQNSKGKLFIVKNLDELLTTLNSINLREEGIIGRTSIYRVKQGENRAYLIKNNNPEVRLNSWLPFNHFSEDAAQVIVGNPRTGESFLADHKVNPSGGLLVRLVAEPTELLTVTEVGKSDKKIDLPPLGYEEPIPLKTIEGNWTISWNDYDGNPHKLQTNLLRSWTEIPELKLYSGVVAYETSFVLSDGEFENPDSQGTPRNSKLFLDIGKVHDSAQVYINGKKAGATWTSPFMIDISPYIVEGTNALRLEVVNKSQNRIIDLHQRGIDWQKCELQINDGIHAGALGVGIFTPVISGLLGPVVLALLTDCDE